MEELNQRQIRAIEFLQNNESIKTQQYARLNAISDRMALVDLNELVKLGYVKKVGHFKGVYYVLNEEKFKQAH